MPRWLAPVTLLLAGIGIGLGSYLTITHYDTHVALYCSGTGVVDCAQVTSSSESVFLGVPVAVWGLAYFVLALPFLVPAAWRSRSPVIRLGRLAGAVGGMGFVLWLVFAELVRIHHICLYCTGVHVVTLLLFLVIVYGTVCTLPPIGADDDEENDPLAPVAD